MCPPPQRLGARKYCAQVLAVCDVRKAVYSALSTPLAVRQALPIFAEPIRHCIHHFRE